jgi:hypothetical protein
MAAPGAAAAAPQAANMQALINTLTQAQNDRRQDDAAGREERIKRTKLNKWSANEKSKIEKNDGTCSLATRNWLRAVRAAMTRTPQLILAAGQQPAALIAAQAQIDVELGLELIAGTTCGEFGREVDRHRAAQPNDAAGAICDEMEAVFLGDDETAEMRADLRKLRQKGGPRPENQIHAFSRSFTDLADQAYPVGQRIPDKERELAELFISALSKREVADELFKHQPPLITLNNAVNAAAAIHARLRRTTRVWADRNSRQEEPMEVGPLDVGATSLERRIGELEKQLAQALAVTPQPPAPQFQGQRHAGRNTSCYNCGKNGHFARDCRGKVNQQQSRPHKN